MEGIGAWVLDVIAALGYTGLALLLVAENLFPPIPSEIVLPLAGFLVGRGDLVFWAALLSSTFGSVAGALILYALGRYGGPSSCCDTDVSCAWMPRAWTGPTSGSGVTATGWCCSPASCP